MLRRRDTYVAAILSYEDITLNPNNYHLSCEERSVMLPKLEYLLMAVLPYFWTPRLSGATY